MAVRVSEKSLPGVFLIEPAVHRDARGSFVEIYHRVKYGDLGLAYRFVQDNHSHSVRGTLRGLHYQLRQPQGKLIYAVSGKIFDVAVDIRRGSPTFGRWVGTVLSSENKHQLLVPQGFAHGFCVLSDTADVIYKCTDLYAEGDDYGIFWADPTIQITWPIEAPILSEKDRRNPKLGEIPVDHLPRHTEVQGPGQPPSGSGRLSSVKITPTVDSTV